MQALEAGSHVRLKGLQSQIDLNGRQGTIQAYDPYSGRYVITMTSGGPSKRIRLGNVELLELSEINDDPVADGSRFHHGTKVMIFGLRSLKALNGKIGTVRHFDFSSGRYDVEIPGQPPKRLKPDNLRPVNGKGNFLPHRQSLVDHTPPASGGGGGGGSSVCQGGADDVGPNNWPKGVKVRLHGLRSPTASPWNGLIASVHCWESSSGRYVVALPDGTPRKIKPKNLQGEDGAGEGDAPAGDAPPGDGAGGAADPTKSICKDQGVDTQGFQGPGGIQIGMKVVLHGLKSAAARSGHWNGMIGTVHCFDAVSQRFVVLCPDKVPRKLKAANLLNPKAAGGAGGAAGAKGPPGAGSVCQNQATKGFVGPGGLAIGSKVRLRGLKSQAAVKGHWNGIVGVIHCFVAKEQRYVVACPDGMPRKLKLANLQKVGAGATAATMQPDTEGAPQATHAKSICGAQPAVVGPGGLAIGTKVALFGLTSKAAMAGRWNGMVGIIHCYDASSLRYVIAMSDGHPRKIKVENLAIITTAVTQAVQNQTASKPAAPKKVQWLKGAYVRLLGLKSAAELNGQVASVVAYENATQRYVVKVPGIKRLKRIRVENLADVASSEPTVAPPVVPVVAVANVIATPATPAAPAASAGSGHQLSICNAYATHSPIEVFAVSPDGKHYTHVVKALDFQSCSDVDDLASDKVGSLAFIIGKFQVAKQVVDFASLTPGQGLELVVFRKDKDSLQALVRENPVEIGDSEAYYMHIVNAYAGRKTLELHVQRGKFLKKLPLDKTFRLSTTKAINMVLSDGTQKLKLSFQPRRAKTYCIMTTGVDEGLRGEPRNVGLVAHEIGTWTSSEEMVNADGSSSDQAEPPPPASHPAAQPAAAADQAQEEEEAPEAEEAPTPKRPTPSLGLASVLGNLFGRGR